MTDYVIVTLRMRRETFRAIAEEAKRHGLTFAEAARLRLEFKKVVGP